MHADVSSQSLFPFLSGKKGRFSEFQARFLDTWGEKEVIVTAVWTWKRQDRGIRKEQISTSIIVLFADQHRNRIYNLIQSNHLMHVRTRSKCLSLDFPVHCNRQAVFLIPDMLYFFNAITILVKSNGTLGLFWKFHRSFPPPPIQCWVSALKVSPLKQHFMGGGGEGQVWEKEPLLSSNRGR